MNESSIQNRPRNTCIMMIDNTAIIDVPHRQRLHLYKVGSITVLVFPARIAYTGRKAMGEQTGDHKHDHDHEYAHNESGHIHDAHTDFDHDHDHDDHDDHGGRGHEHGKVDADLYGNKAGLRAVQISTAGGVFVAARSFSIPGNAGRARPFSHAP